MRIRIVYHHVMPRYRRLFVPGACYFFTVNLADRGSDRLVRDIESLRRAVAATRALHPFTIDAWVVLPDHVHAVWTLPAGDDSFSTRWSSIKRLFSWHQSPGEARSASRIGKRERGIWQRRFWEHMIRDEADYRAHVDYVHFNPVRHCLVSHATLWRHSTIHRAIAQGDLPANWAADATAVAGHGERTRPPP